MPERPASDLRVLISCDAAVERNGVGSYYGDLIEQLSDRLAAIKLIAPGHGPKPWLSFPLPGDRTQQAALPSPMRMRAAFRDFAPDVVVIATPGPYGMSGARLARRAGVPFIYGFHTHFEALSALYWGRLMTRLATHYLESRNRKLFEQSALVLAHSDSMVKLARDLGARRAELAATLLPARFDEAPEPRSGPVRNFLFVGRLAAEKRIDRLLDAAAKRPELSFSFAGRGPLTDAVIEAEQRLDNVHHLGWVERDRIPALLAEHDALVLPSDVESFGTVALEAVACARPALVSRHCGIGEWPQLAPALYRFDPVQDGALVHALDALVDLDEDERMAQARAGVEAYAAIREQGRERWLTTLIEVADGR
ncbi:MAG: glycosyltransferase [Gammaproteobacteria bacterium]|jgi:glycosyltransferase involved in cell wall biosynthesis|nr:glycosyltransferase [Gammaproteobacteria bacterium]